jgi:mutator protein MutT
LEIVINKVDVVAAVLRKDGKFFLAQRAETMHLGGQWEFPGGKLEEGETHEEALKREIMEELCIEIKVGELMGEAVHDYPEKNRIVHLYFYAAEHTGGVITLTEHQQMKWLEKSELRTIDIAEADRAFIEYLIVN